MARPEKKGLDYYPLDVNIFEDEKIELLTNEYGPLGFSIYIWLLNQIFKNGYYLKVDLDRIYRKMKIDLGYKYIKDKETVGKVMHFCSEIGLFSLDLLLNEHIITSASIQDRYRGATVRRRNNSIQKYCIESDVVLSEHNETVNVNNNEVNVNKNGVIVNKKYTNKRKVNKNIYTSSKYKKDNVFCTLLLKGDKEFKVYDETVEELKRAYKNKDVEAELLQMSLWCKSASPSNRKTERGVMKFITGWLSRNYNQNSFEKKRGVSVNEYPDL